MFRGLGWHRAWRLAAWRRSANNLFIVWQQRAAAGKKDSLARKTG
jgi:hypothetical protein